MDILYINIIICIKSAFFFSYFSFIELTERTEGTMKRRKRKGQSKVYFLPLFAFWKQHVGAYFFRLRLALVWVTLVNLQRLIKYQCNFEKRAGPSL